MAEISYVVGVNSTIAVRFSCRASQHSAPFSTLVSCSAAVRSRRVSSCCGARPPRGGTDSHWVRQESTGQRSLPPVLVAIQNPTKQQHCHKIIARGGRSLLYENEESYVLMEPGEEEQFVTHEELQARLKSWLAKWPANELPEDLNQFESLDDVVTHLVDSGCELDLGGGLGSIQWFEVRLES